MRSNRSRLSNIDAANFLRSTKEWSTDWLMYWVFDDVKFPPAECEELRRHFQRRYAYLNAFNRRVAEVPRNWGPPYWMHENAPLDEHFRFHEPGKHDWEACCERIADSFTRPLDAKVRTWQVDVFAGVAGTPGVPSATVVLLQVSHAMLTGAAMPGIGSALFGDNPRPVQVDGLGPATGSAMSGLEVAGEAARRVVEYWVWRTRLRVDDWRRSRDGHHLQGDDVQFRTPTVLNGPSGQGRRKFRIVRLRADDLRGKGLSVTVVGLTAMSIAMQRYIEQHGQACPPDLASIVTVSLGDIAAALGANRIGAAVVDLFPRTESPPERAHQIRLALETERRRVGGSAAVSGYEEGGAIPYKAYQASTMAALVRPGEQKYLSSTALTSINCGRDSGWSLCDRPFTFAGMTINVTASLGLVHSFVGTDDGLTVSVMAASDVLPDIDGYVGLLAQAFREVTSALT